MQHTWIGRVRKAASAAGMVLVAGLSAAALVGMSAPRHVVTGDPSPGDSVDAVLPLLLGRSGKLRAIQATPDGIRGLPVVSSLFEGVDPQPGVHDLGLTTPEGESFFVLALIPFETKRGARVEGYNIGFWPSERGRASRYDLPQGFIQVTPDNQQTPLSEHFRLADFVTHDQRDVWPKMLVITPRLIDKLELIAAELERLGKPSTLRVMSGFRTPQYNARGVCRRCGRAKDSRHMYGDAADIFVDGNGDGRMDDLDGDGRVTVRDARFLASVADDVEAQHPDLIGGIGIYKPTRTHGPFVHVDARGFVARW
jgi:Bacterial protein of unknown function (DUF882)